MTTCTVRDRDRVLTFTGIEIGAGTSFRAGKDRWMETRIFLTEAGSYVVATTGRSMVAGEVDRCRAQVCETAAGAVGSLYQYDENEIRYMTKTARLAAERAAEVDRDFGLAFNVEHVA